MPSQFVLAVGVSSKLSLVQPALFVVRTTRSVWLASTFGDVPVWSSSATFRTIGPLSVSQLGGKASHYSVPTQRAELCDLCAGLLQQWLIAADGWRGLDRHAVVLSSPGDCRRPDIALVEPAGLENHSFVAEPAIRHTNVRA